MKLAEGPTFGTKLMMAMMATTLSVLLLASGANLVSDYFQLRQNIVHEVETYAASRDQATTAALIFDDATTAAESLHIFSQRSHIELAVVYDSQGAVFASYRRDESMQIAPLTGEVLPGHVFHEDHLSVYADVLDSNARRIGTIYIERDLDDITALFTENVVITGVTLFFAVLIAFGIAVYFERLITRPVDELVSAASRVARDKDYSVRARKISNDELGVLTDSFNEMLDQIQVAASDLSKAKDAAEAASRAKSEFLANISHEVRTPLNGVIGMTELTLDTRLNAEQRDYVDTIRTSADQLLSLINDILDFSKIEAGKLELAEEPFSLRRLMHDTLAPLRARAESAGLDLSHTVADSVPDRLTGDPNHLRQVLTNIVSNAIKFTTRGRIDVRVRREGDLANDQTVYVKFDVQDTGCGIPKDRQEAIFHAFEQADTSSTREFGGTGLGLAIASSLVRMMGGTIHVTSEVGVGSTFWFTAYLGIDTGAAGAASNEPPRSAGYEAAPPTRRVLLVEDNPVNQKIGVHTLTMQGFAVDVANDGREALKKIEAARYDIVLMDMQMPSMDGLEATRAIRQREAQAPSHPHLPIVAMTANNDSEDRDRCLEAGMDAFISKPFKPSELTQVIDQMLNA
ncbi:MAG: response regulator [Phycisphaera sp.]|nr:response regulator [Phycisphaera sp.]